MVMSAVNNDLNGRRNEWFSRFGDRRGVRAPGGRIAALRAGGGRADSDDRRRDGHPDPGVCASTRRIFAASGFAGCECHLKGNNDLLTLTQPQAIEDIHFAYAMAGADIIETNTFTATSIAQADYGMQEVGPRAQPRRRAARARAAIEAATHDGRPRFVAGALGPDQPHRVDLARRQRSGLSRRQLRRACATPTPSSSAA